MKKTFLSFIAFCLLSACSTAAKMGCQEGLGVRQFENKHIVSCKKLQFEMYCRSDLIEVNDQYILCTDFDGKEYQIWDETKTTYKKPDTEAVGEFVQEQSGLFKRIKDVVLEGIQKIPML